MTDYKTIVIIGAGPAGLTAAYSLLKHRENNKILVLEKESSVGGLSKTFGFDGNLVDIGGHRYFSKNPEVISTWDAVLPLQDGKMQIRKRRSHILYSGNFIEYPISFSWDLFKALGIRKSYQILISYLCSISSKREINSLEDYYIHHFGDKLYRLFFENYTEKLWGIPASNLSPDWGSQRVSRLSIGSILSTALKCTHGNIERSLISSFRYPTYGAGQIWETMAGMVKKQGVQIEVNSPVLSLEYDGFNISEVSYLHGNQIVQVKPDMVVSSMPLQDLILKTRNCPENVVAIARNLQYRDMIIVAVCIPKTEAGALLSKHRDDCWVYLQDENVQASRLQILNNWSEHMVSDNNNYLLELEYFCNEQSVKWCSSDDSIIEQAFCDLLQARLITTQTRFSNSFVKRIIKAYPVYTGAYYQLQEIRDWINDVPNLICVGRNGQHRYNNMDHSMETGFIATEVILGNRCKKEQVWNVNSDTQYQETIH